MKKLFNSVVNWSLWQPAAMLMRQFHFLGKMAIISIAFLVPIISLLWIMVSGKLQDIHFIALERHGVAYASAIYPAIDAAGVWRQQARNAAFGEGGEQLPQAAQAFDKAFDRLKALDAEFGPSLGATAAFAAVRSAVQTAQSAQPTAGTKADPEAVYNGMIGVSRTLAKLLDTVTDGSGLALDPEMATYYLMSAALLRAPEVIQTTVAEGRANHTCQRRSSARVSGGAGARPGVGSAVAGQVPGGSPGVGRADQACGSG